jgi:hypothetical protein
MFSEAKSRGGFTLVGTFSRHTKISLGEPESRSGGRNVASDSVA